MGSFIPRWTLLDSTEGAIKYEGFFLPRRVRAFFGWCVEDLRVTACTPGIWWYWPVTTIWQPYPVARQTDRLECQTIESKDGKTFIVAGTITYQVVDLMALLTTTHSATTNTRELAASAVHDICCDYDYAELQVKNQKGTLKTELKNEAQRQLAEYGVKVLKLQVTSLARCRVYKISQSTASEET